MPKQKFERIWIGKKNHLKLEPLKFCKESSDQMDLFREKEDSFNE